MRALAIGAHPDDIEPQMGGTIAKLTESGHEVLIVQFNDIDGELNDTRFNESCDAAKILGAKIIHLHYDQNNFIFERNLVKDLDKIILEFKPTDIFTCWEHDSHQDHQVVSKAVLAATRKNDTNLYYYEPIIPGGITTYDFKSNYFVDITDTMEVKIKSVRAHKSQLERFGEDWVEAIYGRAKLRGFQINVKYAEAFQIVKLISKI